MAHNSQTHDARSSMLYRVIHAKNLNTPTPLWSSDNSNCLNIQILIFCNLIMALDYIIWSKYMMAVLYYRHFKVIILWTKVSCNDNDTGLFFFLLELYHMFLFRCELLNRWFFFFVMMRLKVVSGFFNSLYYNIEYVDIR